MKLFEHAAGEERKKNAPLADRMRPERMEELVGQTQAVGPESFLRRAILQDRVPSLILWGPPGTGKTTLASIIARTTRHEFVPFSAVLGGVKEVRVIVAQAADRQRMHGQRTLLFVDEIHRFNKAQQDAFLPHVENGTVVLVGATTENPSFAVNNALISRARVVRLTHLTPEDVVQMCRHALETPAPRGLDGLAADDAALLRIADFADGDGRRALNLLELAAQDATDRITVELVDGVQQEVTTRHDRDGDMHYDVISAFIKSMRASDPDATLYYLARMIEGGEEPRFIMRRLVIFAAEDVANADPRALTLTVSAAQGFETIGMPEGALLMAHAATYLATAPKSNAAYAGLNEARRVVAETGSLPVPMHLRRAATGLMSELGYGQGYKYPHDHGGFIPGETHLPDAIADQQFYQPSQNGYEARIHDWLKQVRLAKDSGDIG